MKRFLFAALAALGILLLSGGCGGGIGIKTVGSDGWKSYNTQSIIVYGMSSDTTNLLGNYLLLDMMDESPEGLVAALEELLPTDRTQEVRIALAETGILLAQRWKDSNPDRAAKYYLTVLLHAQDYLNKIIRMPNISIFDPDILVAIRCYNSALTGLFAYLKERELHNANAYELNAAGGQQVRFIPPLYMLPVKKENIRDFKLCADYRAVNLTHHNRRFGYGVQLICELEPHSVPETVFAEDQVIPGTLVLRITADTDSPGRYSAQLQYLDSRSYDTVPDNSFPLPLAQDFSIPLAYMVRNPPAVNLIRRAFQADAEAQNEGLYHLEPHHDDRIPIVLVHGLMSDVRTWMQMINTLLSDPVLRKHYRFMGFTYSSGNPIFISAMHLRQALQKERDKLVRDGRDMKNFDRMVVVGHSMGGLLTRLLISKSDMEFLQQNLSKGFFETLKKHHDDKLPNFLTFEPFGSVKRVIFIAVPHRGANLADSWLARWASSLVHLPKSLLDLDVDSIIALTGIGNLSTNSRALRLMEKMPMASIPLHSIIGNKNGGDIPGGSDGVVPYRSSHLNTVQSEKVVQSGHSVQQNPLAIQEIRRILREHLKSFPDIEAEFEK